MSLMNDFNLLEDKLDGINLTFFTFFSLFGKNEDKLLWCGYPIFGSNADIIMEYVNAQLQWIQQNSIYVPDYNTGDYIQYKNDRQKRMTFLVNTLYKISYGQLLSANETNVINTLDQIRKLSILY